MVSMQNSQHSKKRPAAGETAAHITAQTAIDDGKVFLTQRNSFSEMFKFSMRALFPCICPVRVVAMYALQPAGYLPASDSGCPVRGLYDAREALFIALREHSKRVTASDTYTFRQRSSLSARIFANVGGSRRGASHFVR